MNNGGQLVAVRFDATENRFFSKFINHSYDSEFRYMFEFNLYFLI
jgi:hypothetical protein